MGLLDDAIREHLELKRARGADPEEVARQEDEALGDPRSGEFVQPEEEPALPPAFEPEPEPEPEAAAPAPDDDEGWLEDELPEPQPTAEFTPAEVEPEPEAPEIVPPDEEPGPDEDVLGETPDFLQETPEHDRLWFEQKPPRDFDFDN